MSPTQGSPVPSETEDMGVPPWYVVFTTPRHEKQIAWQLGQRRIECFLPLYKTKHRWKNRCTVTLELPLFPSYLFVRINPHDHVQVLRIPRVLSIVSRGRELSPVPDRYVTGLRDGLLSGGIEPHPGLQVGDRVRITSGSMAGMEGILERQKSSFRVVLKLEMIGRSVAVEVSLEDIESADGNPNRLSLIKLKSISDSASND